MLVPGNTIRTDDRLPFNGLAGLPALQGETLGDARVCVAILDGPVDLSHPSLVDARLRLLETLVPGTPGRGPACSHGTHVASIIFAQPRESLQGIAPQCRGLIIPVFSDSAGDRLAPCSQLDLARALLQAVQQGAQIINVSGGQFAPTGAAYPLLADAVRYCVAQGVLIVAATGNEGCACLHVPAALPGVLAVGAMGDQGVPFEYSNWGEPYQIQGILAPGTNIVGADLGGRVVKRSGTSFATAIVSGVSALLLSLQFKQGRVPDPLAIAAALIRSARGCDYQPVPDCRHLLAGRLNVEGVRDLRNGGGMKFSLCCLHK